MTGCRGCRSRVPPDAYPTKDEMADYLEAYAARFGLPVRLRMTVEHVVRQGTGYVLRAGGWRIEADRVVVATGAFHRPQVPAFASALAPGIRQLHAAQYRTPAQLQNGPVLIVGAGNSGAEIAMDLARHHSVWLSGRDTGRLPLVLRAKASGAVCSGGWLASGSRSTGRSGVR
jgi:putative flavoprotein involved in K+ transport